jgi:hypothetical protein
MYAHIWSEIMALDKVGERPSGVNTRIRMISYTKIGLHLWSKKFVQHSRNFNERGFCKNRSKLAFFFVIIAIIINIVEISGLQSDSEQCFETDVRRVFARVSNT